MEEHVVYILQSLKDGSFYVGYTSFLILRFREHQEGKSNHTSKHLPYIVRHIEVFDNKTNVLRREREIKNKKSRSYISTLIDKMNNGLCQM
jgi:putative endonuclease